LLLKSQLPQIWSKSRWRKSQRHRKRLENL